MSLNESRGWPARALLLGVLGGGLVACSTLPSETAPVTARAAVAPGGAASAVTRPPRPTEAAAGSSAPGAYYLGRINEDRGNLPEAVRLYKLAAGSKSPVTTTRR